MEQNKEKELIPENKLEEVTGGSEAVPVPNESQSSDKEPLVKVPPYKVR